MLEELLKRHTWLVALLEKVALHEVLGLAVVTATALFLQDKLVSADLGQSFRKKSWQIILDEQVRNR